MTNLPIPEGSLWVRFDVRLRALGHDKVIEREFELRVPDDDLFTLPAEPFGSRYILPLVSRVLAEIREYASGRRK